ncbi:MAG: TonB-dependent receptor [Elusimicrobia bacterium]|nr:TonB-dependent receptor [Elusimicrobiota bacterium]
MKKAPAVFVAVVLALFVPRAYSQESGEIYLSVSRSSLKGIPKPADAVNLYIPRAQSAAASSAADLLETGFPVLLRRSNGASGLASAGMRGFAARQTAVLFDGMRVPADLTGTVDLSALPSADIERVEILPGAWSSVQGANAEGGVINFVTRTPNPGVTTASLGTAVGSYGGNTNTFSFLGGAPRVRTALRAARDASSGFQKNSASGREFFSGKAVVAVGETGKLSFNVMRNNSRTGVPGGTPVPVDDWNGRRERAANSPTDLQRSSLGLGRAALDMPLSENVRYSLEAEGGVNRLFSHSAWSDELTRTLTSRGQFALSFSNKAEAGVEYEKSLLKSDAYGDHFKQTAALFAQWALEPVRGLSVVPSFRYDRNVGYADQANPRLAVVYSPDFVWKFSAQAGRAWQAPTFADLYNPWVPAADRSPDLKPEHSWQTQAAVSASFGSGIWASLGAYYSDVQDRIALDPSKSWAAYNLDSAFNRGVEGGLGFKSASFSAGLGWVHNTSKGRTSGTYKLLSFSPGNRFSLNAEVKTSVVDIRSKAYYSERQYTGADRGGLKLPSYLAADLYLSKTLDGFEVFAGADNVLDAHYAQTADTVNGYYPLPGRVLKCGLNVRFL